ncbi:MAG: hypothetical protein PVJ34_15040 [Anaerolineae bacterium]|jgi:hypothetical protein
MRKLLVICFVLVAILSSCQFSHLGDSSTLSTTSTAEVEPTATIAAMPEYIGFVSPHPGESLSMAEYKALAPSLGWNASEPGICVSLFPHPLMEPGDTPTAKEWLSQVHLLIDGDIITKYHSLLETNSEGGRLIDPDTGELVWKEPDGSPFGVCYAASLGIGYHTVTIVVEKTSGEQVSYAWSFAISE